MPGFWAWNVRNQQIVYIEQCSMINGRGEGGLFSKNSDAYKVEDIARTYFKQSFTTFSIVNTVRQDSTWFVKGFVTSFGKQSTRILAIDCKTGNIISCKPQDTD